MVAHFSERGRLTEKDVVELRQILEKLDDGS
jgi:predicted transcriptional regulator